MTGQAQSSDSQLIAAELSVQPRQVEAVLELFAEGSTVAFIARYRKERSGGLDEQQIRQIEQRAEYLRELNKRREAILSSIEEQGKLSEQLAAQIKGCTSKAELEDLYLPYKPKRRTRATVARERGLTALAQRILAQPKDGDPQREAAAFVDPAQEVADPAAALAGARDIVAEELSERIALRSLVREVYERSGRLEVRVRPKMKDQRSKFEQYYDTSEPLATMPSHRYLAVCRGESEQVLRAQLVVDRERLLGRLVDAIGGASASPFWPELATALADALDRLLAPSAEKHARAQAKQRADRAAVAVFAENLRHLLLAAPYGEHRMLAIDPGLRTGSKCVALDATGSFVDAVTIYPARGQAEAERAAQTLSEFIAKHRPEAIAVGNGTGGRETESFVRQTLRQSTLQAAPMVVSVNEAGASVYSASEVGIAEFPKLDVTLRGAISIGRRLQDPLAELVKIEPKSIGVGQYQHDVDQSLLARALNEVVESCVNHVGVELNTASAQLLTHVSGVGPKLAERIVAYRSENGPFVSRKDLMKVSGVGARVFEQAAGFLRIRAAKNPLDASAVHPERYGLVKRIAKDLGADVSQLVGDEQLIARIDAERYFGDGVAAPTINDIIAELRKPGRDPRADFEAPRFSDDVCELSDLKVGMRLEGVVTNVTAFGAFVDVGVHQDGLVHISQLADRFIKDPAEVVTVGQRLRVHVLEVDLERRRIALSARAEASSDSSRRVARPESANPPGRRSEQAAPAKRPSERKAPAPQRFSNNPFAKLGERKPGDKR
ncbi:MAG: RNA-binding transcriptional accessory protein [Deltaproteobacteria bacterium]|nr:RNA-binding transcriptional accessory protein [Deltaproteobacteria bacterium]